MNNVYVNMVLQFVTINEGPEYKSQELREYENSPFIEALPDLFEVDEVARQFTIYPHVDESERKQRTFVRHHMIIADC